MNIFWGYEDFVDIFFKVKVQNWDIFLVGKISNIFWELEIPDIFWGER